MVIDPLIFQHLILGIIQGIAEWLPVSSEGVLVLVKTRFFPEVIAIADLLKIALLLHLGTFFAALIYLWNDVSNLFKTLFHYRNSDISSKKLLKFLIISTFISGIIGLFFLYFISGAEKSVTLTGRGITVIIGFFLLGTASIQLKARHIGHKDRSQLSKLDSFILGIGQGISTLPGISRSGITTSLLLIRNFDKKEALKISFLMSLPIVLGGNLVINIGLFTSLSLASVIGIISAFVFGLLAIHGFIKLSERINFGWFVLIIAFLMILSGLVL